MQRRSTRPERRPSRRARRDPGASAGREAYPSTMSHCHLRPQRVGRVPAVLISATSGSLRGYQTGKAHDHHAASGHQSLQVRLRPPKNGGIPCILLTAA